MTGDDDAVKMDNVVSIKDAKPEERVYARTIIVNHRRYDSGVCKHKGPFIVDTKVGGVECGDCGIMLNPIYVLEVLAGHETYWNRRQHDLSKHLTELDEQIKGRTRTRCTHCGNMTAIKFKHEMPRTWVPQPY